MFKVKHNLCPKPFQEIFNPTTRRRNDWILPRVQTEHKGKETRASS